MSDTFAMPRVFWNSRIYWLTPAVTCVVLGIVAYVDYSLFHQLVELWAVSIAFGIFWFNWHTFRFNRDGFLMMVACGYLAVGVLDLFHVAIFEQSLNLAAQFWVSARLVEAFTLVFATIFYSSRVQPITLLVCALCLSGIFSLLILVGWFPQAHTGQALTELKVLSEYFIIVLLVVAARLVWVEPGLQSIRLLALVAISITIVSEFCFTRFVDPTDLPNIVGHLLKVWSFWIIFCVVVLQNVDKSFESIQKNSDKYKSYFDSAPVAIWTEDLTRVYEALEELRKNGVEDISAYLSEFPEETLRLVQMIDVVEGNAKALETFKVDDVAALGSNIASFFTEVSIEDFKDKFKAVWDQEPVFSTRTQFKDMQGNIVDALLVVPLPDSIDDAGQVMSSILDISKELAAEVETEKAYRLMSNAAVGTLNAVSATVEKRDPYTAGHQQAVAELTAEIAEYLGWEEFRIQGLRFAAAIHNIGNVYIPAEILNRPGKLSKPEEGILRSHPEVGADILANTELPWPVSSVILHHHERWDGSGYPHGLKGNEIMEESLIIGVADMMLAMTSHRPFRAALSHEEALQELKLNGEGWFGVEISRACEAALARRWTAADEGLKG